MGFEFQSKRKKVNEFLSFTLYLEFRFVTFTFSLLEEKSTKPIASMTLNPTRIEHFRNLISLSAADGKIENIEHVALSKIAFEWGIPLDRLNVMISKASEYIYFIPQNNEDREKQLDQMISLAKVDGEFAPAEYELIKMVGGKLGFSSEEVDQIIADHVEEEE